MLLTLFIEIQALKQQNLVQFDSYIPCKTYEFKYIPCACHDWLSFLVVSHFCLSLSLLHFIPFSLFFSYVLQLFLLVTLQGITKAKSATARDVAGNKMSSGFCVQWNEPEPATKGIRISYSVKSPSTTSPPLVCSLPFSPSSLPPSLSHCRNIHQCNSILSRRSESNQNQNPNKIRTMSSQ